MRRINWTRLWDEALFFGMGATFVGIIMWIFVLATN
jgi:hypothetical protein